MTTYTLTSGVSGNGNITKNPDQATYAAGEVVTLEAVAEPGWLFSGWSGAVDGNQNPVTVTMDADKTITATFVPEQVTTYTLTSGVSGNGNITKNPDQATYAAGDVVTLEAVAEPGWIFSGWSGAVDGNQNPLTVTMDADKTITATFVPEAGSVDVFVSDNFNGCSLDSELWTFVDPLGDATLSPKWNPALTLGTCG